MIENPPDCAICGAIVEENRTEVTADWTTQARRDDYVLHEGCASAVIGGWHRS
jgi:hypothetical protein